MPAFTTIRRSLVLAPLTLALLAHADPAARRLEIDFSRQVPARNLNGLAARSDGRLVPGPALTALDAKLPELVWCLEPDATGGWLIGTGAEGHVVRATLDGTTAKVEDVVDLEETNVFAICATAPGEFLAGAAPGGVLYLIKDGKVVSRASIGAEVIWDIRRLDGDDYLVATGTPATIKRVNLAQFRKAGVKELKADEKPVPVAGVSDWATIRDRNVRRLIVTADDRVIAGSSPRGAVYEFKKDGGAPFILGESKDAEVADLYMTPGGILYAALVYNAGGTPDRRPTPRTPQPVAADPTNSNSPDFTGRSEIVEFGKDRLPETVVARNGVAFYKLAGFGDTLLIGAGEHGEILGYDAPRKALLTFAGAPSAQVNGLMAVAGTPGKFLVLRNNFSGLSLLDFNGATERTAETQRLDFTIPSHFGLLQFTRFRDLPPESLSVDYKFGNSADESEGWSEWIPATREIDAFRFGDAAGRYARVRLRMPADVAHTAEIGRGYVFNMPQDRPPVVQDFRIFPPGLSLIPMPEPPSPATLPLGQFLYPNQQPQQDSSTPSPTKNTFLASQLVAQPGNQLIYWNSVDPDGDNLLATIEVRPDDAKEWTTIASNIDASFFNFSTAEMAEGLYVVRLTLHETSPRPEADRETTTYESDDLAIDRTPPDITESSVTETGTAIVVHVTGRDKWSILRGARVVLNNGYELESILPVDGILDGPEESFVLEIPRSAATGATNAEVMVVDVFGNRTTKRIDIKP